MSVSVPAVTDPVEIRADWLECEALRSGEGRVSLEDYVRVIRRGGGVDALDDAEDDPADRGSGKSQQVAEEAFSELENRAKACGKYYPFEIEKGLLKLKENSAETPYVLLLLLTFKEPTTGHEGTAALFEKICAHAAKQYFGGEANGACAIRFGSPRKVPLAKLSQAIDDLCTKILEGGGCRDEKYANHLGDEGLDIVAWKHFSDLKAGKIIAFGQCAGGQGNWTDKLNELDGVKFANKLFRGRVVVPPIRFFFIPRRVPADLWENVSIDAGIIFDRCRITSCLDALDGALLKECEKITKSLADEVLRGKKKAAKKAGSKKAKKKAKNR